MSRLKFILKKAQLLQKAKLKKGKELSIEQACEVLAQTAGYDSWKDYKKQLEVTTQNCPINGSTLNLWFRSLEEAEEYQLEHGGEILAVEKDFVIINS